MDGNTIITVRQRSKVTGSVFIRNSSKPLLGPAEFLKIVPHEGVCGYPEVDWESLWASWKPKARRSQLEANRATKEMVQILDPLTGGVYHPQQDVDSASYFAPLVSGCDRRQGRKCQATLPLRDREARDSALTFFSRLGQFALDSPFKKCSARP